MTADEQTRADAVSERSLGELVASATREVSRLIQAEIALAKMELKDDAKRAGVGAATFVVAGFIGSIVLILLSIALADGLGALGIWNWAAFLIVSGLYVLLAGALVGFGFLRMRKINGIQRTRRTLAQNLAVLRGGAPDALPAPSRE